MRRVYFQTTKQASYHIYAQNNFTLRGPIGVLIFRYQLVMS